MAAKKPKRKLGRKSMKAVRGGVIAIQPQQIMAKAIVKLSPPPDPVRPGDFSGLAP